MSKLHPSQATPITSFAPKFKIYNQETNLASHQSPSSFQHDILLVQH
jgi:hypothetical protein